VNNPPTRWRCGAGRTTARAADGWWRRRRAHSPSPAPSKAWVGRATPPPGPARPDGHGRGAGAAPDWFVAIAGGRRVPVSRRRSRGSATSGTPAAGGPCASASGDQQQSHTHCSRQRRCSWTPTWLALRRAFDSPACGLLGNQSIAVGQELNVGVPCVQIHPL